MTTKTILLCERKHPRGLFRKARAINHRDGNPRNNAPENLEALCNSCSLVVQQTTR